MTLRSRVILLLLVPLCQLANLVALVWMLAAILFGSRRAWTIAVGYDQLGNAAFGGYEDETISSRATKRAADGIWWAVILCRILDAIDPGHTKKSLEVDEGRRVVK